MRYIFLIVGLWNLWGAVNYTLMPGMQAANFGYPMGNIWETQFIGGIAVVFSLIYFSFFRREPEEDMLYLVYFFAFGKFWVFVSGIICYLYYDMPLNFMLVLGVGDLVMGLLFVLYIILYKRRQRTA